MRYFLSLGSNLNNRERNIEEALDLLEGQGLRKIQVSSLYETQPVEFQPQPWFLNLVVEVEAELEPESLLKLIKNIEQKMGRKPGIPKGPRLIDIDILLADDLVVKTSALEIPHPRMQERKFVLRPLAEICPHFIHPVLKETIEALLAKTSDQSLVKKWLSPS